MAQADSNNSTVTPAARTRRRFLSQVASVAAGGTVLALATVPPRPALAAQEGAAGKTEAIFGLIEDHKAAIAAEHTAMTYYGDLEETIPEHLRRGDMFCFEVTEVASDDPRWTAACHRYNDASINADQIAIEMLEVPILSHEGLAAVMAYAGEHIGAGYLWPDGLDADEVGIVGREGCLCDWETALLVKAASTMRQLNAVAS
jgi:hypothetical protein